MAVAIDFKVLEYGLHVRAILDFILNNFNDAPRAIAWEAALWGHGEQRATILALVRSALTIVSAAIPTVAVICVAALMFQAQGHGYFIYAASIVIALYLGVMACAGWALFHKALKSTRWIFRK